jgi:ParB-like chromosome segregation protein Spo0J
MRIRDRIKELRRVKASQLAPHPLNWRTHSTRQRDALLGVLADIGYADALLARELPDGSLQLIDGHLRAETTPDSMVPVLILDVDEDEAKRVLATLDPLAGLAEVDTSQLARLLDDIKIDNESVRRMLDELRQNPMRENAVSTDEVRIPQSYQVLIECENESQQQEIYERMRDEGFRCRVVTMM